MWFPRSGTTSIAMIVRIKIAAYNLHQIFNLIDHNLLKQYLKVLAQPFLVLTALFNSFYTLFSFKDQKVTFRKKNFNCSSNHIYLLSD